MEIRKNPDQGGTSLLQLNHSSRTGTLCASKLRASFHPFFSSGAPLLLTTNNFPYFFYFSYFFHFFHLYG